MPCVGLATSNKHAGRRVKGARAKLGHVMRHPGLAALLTAVLSALAGCASASSPPVAPPPVASAASAASASTVVPADPGSAAVPAPPADAPITFIENDYARALSEARSRGVPLFIDTWAPWCHTCLSLRSYVFPDPSLQRFSSRFVWLSLDTERDENAAVVSRLNVHVLPTLYVIEPASEKPVVAWPGSLTAPELADLLDDAAAAVSRGDAGGEAAAALLRGHQASAAGKLDEAITAYRAALAAAPPGWPRQAAGGRRPGHPPVRRQTARRVRHARGRRGAAPAPGHRAGRRAAPGDELRRRSPEGRARARAPVRPRVAERAGRVRRLAAHPRGRLLRPLQLPPRRAQGPGPQGRREARRREVVLVPRRPGGEGLFARGARRLRRAPAAGVPRPRAARARRAHARAERARLPPGLQPARAAGYGLPRDEAVRRRARRR